MSFPNKIDGFGVRRSTTADEFVANSGVESRATFIRGYVYCDYAVSAGETFEKGSVMVMEVNTGTGFLKALGVDALDADHPIGTLFRKAGARTDGSTNVDTDDVYFAGILDAAVTVAAGEYAECVIQVTGLRTDVVCDGSTAIGSPLRPADAAAQVGQFDILVAGDAGQAGAIAVTTGAGADVYLLNPLNL
jgi:hypothetical protein